MWVSMYIAHAPHMLSDICNTRFSHDFECKVAVKGLFRESSNGVFTHVPPLVIWVMQSGVNVPHPLGYKQRKAIRLKRREMCLGISFKRAKRTSQSDICQMNWNIRPLNSVTNCELQAFFKCKTGKNCELECYSSFPVTPLLKHGQLSNIPIFDIANINLYSCYKKLLWSG